jgi:predicted double-glycine peptidase
MSDRMGWGLGAKATLAFIIATAIPPPALSQPLKLIRSEVVRQATASECGLAALAALIGASEGYQITLSDLRQRAADLNLLTDVHIRQGFSIRELVKIAASVGVAVEAKLIDLTDLQQERGPVIAWLSFGRDNNHFTVVNPGSLATGHLLLADPTLGSRRVSERHFMTWWARFEGRGVILTTSGA